MSNTSVLNQAIKYTLDYIDKFWVGCPKGAEELYTKHILNWYDYTDIRDPYILSALALKYGGYKIVSCSQIDEAVNDFYKEKGCGGNGR